VTSGPSGPGLPTGVRAPVGLYHNRNRSYLPSLGRFAQRDPNASGQVVQARMLFGGAGCATCPPPSVNPSEMVGDGPNLHEYVASDPLSLSDASGLFLTLPTILSESFAIGQDAANQAGVKYYGDQAASYVDRVQSAMFDDMYDMDWAMDWAQMDFDFSRGGVAAESYGYRAAECDVSSSGSSGPDALPWALEGVDGRNQDVYMARGSGSPRPTRPSNPHISIPGVHGNSHASKRATHGISDQSRNRMA